MSMIDYSFITTHRDVIQMRHVWNILKSWGWIRHCKKFFSALNEIHQFFCLNGVAH